MTYREYNKPTDFSEVQLTPMKAIMMKCKDCCAYDAGEVNSCEIKTCPLWRLKEMHFKRIKSPRSKG